MGVRGKAAAHCCYGLYTNLSFASIIKGFKMRWQRKKEETHKVIFFSCQSSSKLTCIHNSLVLDLCNACLQLVSEITANASKSKRAGKRGGLGLNQLLFSG